MRCRSLLLCLYREHAELDLMWQNSLLVSFNFFLRDSSLIRLSLVIDLPLLSCLEDLLDLIHQSVYGALLGIAFCSRFLLLGRLHLFGLVLCRQIILLCRWLNICIVLVVWLVFTRFYYTWDRYYVIFLFRAIFVLDQHLLHVSKVHRLGSIGLNWV